MAAGQAAISTGLRGTCCPMAGTDIYQTVENFFSACFQCLEGSHCFRARSWPGLCWLLPVPVGGGCHPTTGAGSNPFHLMPSPLWQISSHYLPWALPSNNLMPPELCPCSSMSPLYGGRCWKFIESSHSVNFTCWAIKKLITLMIYLKFFLYCLNKGPVFI